MHLVNDGGANGHVHVAVFACVIHVHCNVGVAHQLGDILAFQHGGSVFVCAHFVHLLVDDLRVRQGVYRYFFGQLAHEVCLHVGACVHDECDHNGGRHGGTNGAHQRKRCQRGVRLGVVRVLQHHVVQWRAHGKAQTQASQNQHEADVEQGGVIAGHKRHEQRTNCGANKAKSHDQLHAVLVDKLARHHGAHAAANAQQCDEVAAGTRFHEQGVFAKLREEDSAHHDDARDNSADQRDQDIDVTEVMQVDNGVFCSVFANDEKRQQHHENRQERPYVGTLDGCNEVEEVDVFQAVHER